MTTVPPQERQLPVDPRLRARRRAVLRSEGRRRLRRLGTVAGVAGVVLLGWLTTLSPLLDVDQVLVRGAQRTGPETVRQATGVAPGQAMVTLAVDQAAAAVEELPWVATATVERRWPGTVAVSVTERRPVAAVAVTPAGDGHVAGPSWILVDDQGRQLAVVDHLEPQLASIEGADEPARPGEQVRAAAGALELATHLRAALPAVPPRVAVTADGWLQAVVADGTGREWRVRFGPPDGLADKVLALRTLVDGGALDAAPAGVVVDVRVPEAPVLTDLETDFILSTVTRALHNSKSHVEVEGSAPSAGAGHVNARSEAQRRLLHPDSGDTPPSMR